VINVSWEDTKAYASWLSQKTRKAYRLLNEAEWEYCCRAGTITKFAFGDTVTPQQAQFSQSVWAGAKRTVEVGSFPPNAWGLYEMHGNVWEWCEDNWHSSYDGAPNDGSIWAGGDLPLRVLRGGSSGNHPNALSSACRHRYLSTVRDFNAGFRLRRTL